MRTGEALEAFLEELDPFPRPKKKETKEKPDVPKVDLPKIKRHEYYDACSKVRQVYAIMYYFSAASGSSASLKGFESIT